MTENQTKRKPVSKRKKAGNQKDAKSIFVKSVIIFFIIALVLVVLFFLIFRVTNVKVEGPSRYQTSEIIDKSGIKIGKNICFMDISDVAEDIEYKLPYCTNVTVKKSFPSTIKITVKDAKLKYSVILDEGLYAITDGEMKTLETSNVAYTDTILVMGKNNDPSFALGAKLKFTNDDGEDNVKNALADVSTAIEETGIEGIEAINVYDSNDIYLIYQDRIIIKIGNTSNVQRKIALAKKAVEEENKFSPTQYGEMDVREIKKAIFRPMDYKDMDQLVEYDESIEPVEEINEDENPENDEENNQDYGENDG